MQQSRGNRHLPWKTYRSNAANTFSDAEIAFIAQKHALPPDRVAEIGSRLVYDLSDLNRPLGLHPFIEQSSAGKKKRSEIIRMAKRARKDVDTIRELLAPLHVSNEDVAKTLVQIDNLSDRMEAVSLELRHLEDVMAASEKAQDGIYDRSVRDKRRDRDEVRPAVVQSLMLFWAEMGRKSTITTDATRPGTPRSGAFLAFTTDVVLALTDPPTLINDETLRSDVLSIREYHQVAQLIKDKGLA